MTNTNKNKNMNRNFNKAWKYFAGCATILGLVYLAYF